MEGDSPTLLYTFQSGLNVPEHPEYGGLGGRYTPNVPGVQLFANTLDMVVDANSNVYNSPKTTIWCWREFFQNEFAVRPQWTLQPRGSESNASHPPIVMLNGTCGAAPYEIDVSADSTVTFSAAGFIDKDTGTAGP
ncbi:hypothetical protein LTR10_009646 [Elasticomyces elasticus]|nr:hypothetical protein LTR10_009646 [Elasticomyces elasticus]KAK4969938.1 hypothetical protein LTR42_008104 [Elasticomyces elasticus]